jgi:hypothetical protein
VNGTNLASSSALIALMILSVFAIAGLPTLSVTAHAQQTGLTSTCASSAIQEEEEAAASSVNQAEAIARAAPLLASNDAGYNAAFNSIFYRLEITPSCSLNLENVNVVYDLFQNGRPVYTIEVSLNPSATIILNVTKYPAVLSGVSYSNNWSGYEYYNSGGIIQSGASWAEPSAAIPSGQCQWAHCDYEFWVGETHTSGGGSGYIAQTGTDSGVACTLWCTYYNYDWYEFYPGLEVTCNNIAVGDSVTASVWNSYQPSVGGYQYSVSTQDNTSHQLCYSQSTATFYMGVSYYTQYMGETPADSNGRGYAVLPIFSTLSMYGGYYYDSSYNSHTIGSGWSTEYEMALSSTSTRCNGANGYWNICNSAVSSGSFTETYLTSSGT